MGRFPFLLGAPWPVWSIVLAGVGAGYLTWRGYNRRAGEVGGLRLGLLKALRLGSWGLLFLCLLQPIHREFLRDKKASRLTVLLDDSESMSFVDSRSSPPRLTAVKAALLRLHGPPPRQRPRRRLNRNAARCCNVLGNSFNVQLEAFGDLLAPHCRRLNEVQAAAPATDIAKSSGRIVHAAARPRRGRLGAHQRRRRHRAWRPGPRRRRLQARRHAHLRSGRRQPGPAGPGGFPGPLPPHGQQGHAGARRGRSHRRGPAGRQAPGLDNAQGQDRRGTAKRWN